MTTYVSDYAVYGYDALKLHGLSTALHDSCDPHIDVHACHYAMSTLPYPACMTTIDLRILRHSFESAANIGAVRLPHGSVPPLLPRTGAPHFQIHSGATVRKLVLYNNLPLE